MSRPGAAALALLLTAGAFAAQAQVPSLQVYSEFQRIDPFGRVVSADRPSRADVSPREILSPGFARNAHASYHLAVTVPPGTSYSLYMGQNPEDFLGVTVYKEVYVRRGAEWIPDGLEPVTLPYSSKAPDPARPIPGQTTVTFLMDLWTPRDARVIRAKLEPQLFLDGRWLTYPMEVRILPAVIPQFTETGLGVANLERPADTTVRQALQSYLCGSAPGDSAAPATIRNLILRDVQQDIALARSTEKPPGSILLPEILKAAGGKESPKWCQAPVFPSDLGPEWYLRVRDALYRTVN